MAATYTTSVMTVFGDRRVFAGTVHFNDGAENINFANFQKVDFAIAYAQSATTGGMISVVPNSSAVGAVDFGSMTSGDSYNVLVFGK